MGATIGRSIGWRALFGTIAAFMSASCLSYFWASESHRAGELATLMILWVSPVTIMRGAVATVLFGVVGAIMSFEPGGIQPSAFSRVADQFG
jgi:hypothetical protein